MFENVTVEFTICRYTAFVAPFSNMQQSFPSPTKQIDPLLTASRAKKISNFVRVSAKLSYADSLK